MNSTNLSISICIITYKRPLLLKQLLYSLSSQIINENHSINLTIVDNDKNATAQKVVHQFQVESPFPLVYEIEKKRGIPFARNKAISLNKENDVIIFIDDDEIAENHWLQNLITTYINNDYHIVAGPVKREFEIKPPKWIRKLNLFTQKEYKDGEIINSSGTGNILFSNKILELVEGPFDERFSLTGGTDSLLLSDLEKLGYKIIWSKNAIVTEVVPKSRLTLKWILNRSFRIGNTQISHLMIRKNSIMQIALKLISAIFRFIKGLLILIIGILIINKWIIAKGLMDFSRSFGVIFGALGIRSDEYKIIHGS